MHSLALFLFNATLLGFGLAMAAFSVSVANGINAPRMSRALRLMIPGTFAAFQFMMPMIGWYCVRTIAETFVAFQRLIPYIALGLLGLIGGNMIREGLTGGDDAQEGPVLGVGTLILQGVATSIDALSVGFTIAEYRLGAALTASGVIAVVTFLLCAFGLNLGRRFGEKLSQRATVVGGVILILIGLEIYFT